jgi:hypothetical protein
MGGDDGAGEAIGEQQIGDQGIAMLFGHDSHSIYRLDLTGDSI